MILKDIQNALVNARESLLSARNEQGFWEGELSSSALSTATAMVALCKVDAVAHQKLIQQGVKWLVENQNEDGGWGDTIQSFSNISTTLLCWSALNLVAPGIESGQRAGDWIENYVGSMQPDAIAKAVTLRYGKDRTFAVPILMMCAICHKLGDGKDAWKRVLPLPFEVAVFPRSLFAALRLPVVSYALPALIAIGYARFYHAPPLAPLSSFRKWAWPRASKLLQQIQPASGGFLEATPLTSFVTMALASSGEVSNRVVTQGVAFIRASIRQDGSWPIDTNLSTWCTTLATKALIRSEENLVKEGNGTQSVLRTSVINIPAPEQIRIRQWIKGQQYRETHPFTNAKPGGWAWTDLSGGVPDADDTSGALLALHALQASVDDSIEAGLSWLLDLQNRDGGIPTFCKGWGAFPFDRSSSDITAHALRAFSVWRNRVGTSLQRRIDKSTTAALRFLRKQQSPEGYWLPLWFGNQHGVEENNRVYGTSMTLLALEMYEDQTVAKSLRHKANEWLLAQQNEDGGWGGERGCPSSLEETALALEALASSAGKDVLERGAGFIIRRTGGGKHFPASPIGFYFAKLWYFEKLYPHIWVVSALERVSARLNRENRADR